MKHIWLSIGLVTIMMWGCETRTGELERQNQELQAKNDSLAQNLSTRDEYVDDITTSINQVYDDLEAARSKEKMIMKETGEVESSKKPTREEIRRKLLDKITLIDSSLKSNRKTISDLQKKVDGYKGRFAGLRAMVASLKKNVEEREQAVAQLTQRVADLEQKVTESNRMITERDSVISTQHGVINDQTKRINTAYYIVGKRDELEKKGILAKDGGFLWGLLGSTNILATGLNEHDFTPIDKTSDMTITVNGKIDEIIPKRNETVYQTAVEGSQSLLTIENPGNFWQEKYLVIVTD